jgi:hypothetical protein
LSDTLYQHVYLKMLGNIKKNADSRGHEVYGVGLRPLECLVGGFESSCEHVCSSCGCCVLCDELVTRSEES